MPKNYFFDTESIGLYSPTVLIQYAIDYEDTVHIHNLWTKSINESLDLIQKLCENNVIGFNLAHDWFHISRTHGVLSELYPRSKPPSLMDYWDVENTPEAHDNFCLKPQGALDLMLYGRMHEFQATMNQKDITIRRIPRLLADILVVELEKQVKIPKLYFAKREGNQNWKIKNLHLDTTKELTPEEMINITKYNIKIDPHFVNLRLSFHPSTGLKPIMKFLLNKKVDLIENMLSFKRPTEYSWFPSSGAWLEVAQQHIHGWTNDKRRLKYAEDDVIYARDLYDYFGKPVNYIGEYNSMLACMVGSLHWKGYEINLEQIKKQMKIQFDLITNYSKEVNFNSPKQVLIYLKKCANPIEEILITDTKEDTLFAIKNSGSVELRRRADLVLEGRHADKKLNLLSKLNKAKRLYVTFKVTGTKSNRMSGGSMEDSSSSGVGASTKGGSINPQGIKKGSDIREIFILAPKNMVLDAGDFEGYEVSIAEAVYQDKNLKKDLQSGKKIHALWGASIYNKTYEEIKKTDGIPENEPEGYYGRSKRSFFAKLYDAQIPKLASVLQLSEEIVWEGIKRFEERYPGIAKAKEKIYTDFEAMCQPNGIGTAIEWQDPKEYIESFLGFKRYFHLEFKIIKALYQMAQQPTDKIKSVGQLIKVKRRDRIQSASGAMQSAIYAAAFSLQSAVIRAASNHEIQSPGGEITKLLQAEIWKIQPVGITKWLVMPMNIHDELQCPVVPAQQTILKQIVIDFVNKYKKYVTLLKIDWKQNLKSWGDK